MPKMTPIQVNSLIDVEAMRTQAKAMGFAMDRAKIFGQKQKDGTVLYYVSDKAPSVWARIFSNRASQKKRGGEGVRKILRDARESARAGVAGKLCFGGFSKSALDDVCANMVKTQNRPSLLAKDAFAWSETIMDANRSARDRYDLPDVDQTDANQKGEVQPQARTGDKSIAASAPADTLQQPPVTPVSFRPRAPTPNRPNAGAFEKMATRVGREIATRDPLEWERNDAKALFIDALATAYCREVVADSTKGAVCVFGDFKSFEKQARAMLTDDLNATERDSVSVFLDRTPSFLTDAFASLSKKLLGATTHDSKELKSTTSAAYKNGQTKSVHDFRIGGTTYKAVRFLGEGGFGEVFEFEAQDGSGKRVAAKYVLGNAKDKTWKDTQSQVAAELIAHAYASGNQHPNIIGLKGIVRTAEKGVCIVMESAPCGDAWEAANMIKEALENGQITDSQARAIRLTLLKDIADGLSELSRIGMRHDDLKTPNVLIGADAMAKIADFGTARLESVSALTNVGDVDNPRWLSPERVYARDQIRDLDDRLVGSAKASAAKVMEAITKDLGQIAKEELNFRVNELMAPVREANLARIGEKKSEFSVSQASDAWALGICALDLFGVGGFFDNRWDADKTQSLLAFRGRDDDALAPPGVKADAEGHLPGGALAESTGDADLDATLNALLRAEPSDRLSPAVFAQSNFFSDAAVGSIAARDLFVALRSGDSNKLARAKANFEEAQ